MKNMDFTKKGELMRSRPIFRTKQAVILYALILLGLLWAASAAHAQIKPRIIGGHDADQGEYPWMAALYHAEYSPFDGQFCGGVLVHPRYVLTAAHCVEWAYGPDAFKVLIGRTTLSSSAGVIRAVKGWIKHPDYDNWTLAHDLALVMLDTPVDAPALSLIGAGEAALWTPGATATTIGWGATQYDTAVVPNVLQEVEIPIVSDETCLNVLGRYFIPDVMLCAGVLGASPGTGLDPCYGDSGGPLMVKTGSGDWRLVGLVDWGFECGSDRFYGAFSEVAPHREWIQSWPDLPPELSGSGPKLTGFPMVSAALQCSSGAWSGTGVAFSYRWLRYPVVDDLVRYQDEEEIQGAAASEYQLTAADIDHMLVCEVTASNSGGSPKGYSNELGPIRPFQPGPEPDLSIPPAIAGVVSLGGTLACQDGGWITPPESSSYQWLRIAALNVPTEEIAGASSSTYTLVRDDVGLYVACRVTGTSWNGSTSVESAPLGPISGLLPYDQNAPAVTLGSLRCSKSGCRLRVRIDDGEESSGVRAVNALITQLGCRESKTCAVMKPRWVKGEVRGAIGVLQMPRLPTSGRYLALVSAIDNNGNVTDPPARIRLRRGAAKKI
jgi:hypothetical protein